MKKHINKARKLKAREWFKEHGFMPDPNEKYVLHHVDSNLYYDDFERYNQYNVEDLICITEKEHREIHKQMNPKGIQNHKEALKGLRVGEKNPSYGKRWYNNGEIQVLAKECPEGFVHGMLKPLH